MKPRHFLSLVDLTQSELLAVLDRAAQLKTLRQQGQRPPLFERKVLAMIFEKSSTRTRASFEAAMGEGGGTAIFLSPRDSHLGRGEPVEDTARVLSQMADAIMVRTFAHETVETLAKYAQIPVINGLTDTFHPCQLLADLQTFREHRGEIQGCKVAWIGDGNNMCNSYINTARLMEFGLSIATPPDFEPSLMSSVSSTEGISLTHDPIEAATDADLVVTDVWASMGQEDEAEDRRDSFSRFQVNAHLMKRARPDALFMHCLPAHRGEEVSSDIIDDAQSVVWDEAGNRLHAQKALLEFLLISGDP
jgi:ornithine carbamoyltransferase